jgi:hypothetical protein
MITRFSPRVPTRLCRFLLRPPEAVFLLHPGPISIPRSDVIAYCEPG